MFKAAHILSRRVAVSYLRHLQCLEMPRMHSGHTDMESSVVVGDVEFLICKGRRPLSRANAAINASPIDHYIDPRYRRSPGYAAIAHTRSLIMIDRSPG